jgi:hypothetical protein
MAVEFVGIIVTAYGLIRTWREFTGEALFGDAAIVTAARARARRALGTAGDFLRRLRGYPPTVTVTRGRGAITADAAKVSGEGLVGYAPLDPALDSTAALAELDRRTRDLTSRLADEMRRRGNGDAALQSALSAVEEKIDEAVQRLDRQGARIAIGGLRTAATGLGLVLLGLGFQALGVWVG